VTPIDNRIFVLILQHPQEQDKQLGTAQLARLQLKQSLLKVGLSWPGLRRILGREVDPARWGVLFLGTARTAAAAATSEEILLLDRKGQPVAGQREALRGLEGIILLDGNWSQAKALWWRNPWLLKLRRILLQPKHGSLYGSLRKEPRAESLSTIEAAAFCLARLERQPELEAAILAPFNRLLAKYRG